MSTRTIRRLVPVLVLLALLVGCDREPPVTTGDDATLTGPITALAVRTGGDVRVEAAPPGAPATVHRVVHHPSGPAPATVTRRDGATLALDGLCGEDCLVDYEVRLPRGAHVDVDTQAGDVTVADTGAATLRTQAGGITARGVDGTLDAETQAGRVQVSDVRGATAARSQAGSIDVVRVGGPVEATSRAGSVTVAPSAPSNVTASSDAQDVTVTLPAGAYRVDAEDIDQPEVTVPDDPGAPWTVIADTSAGQVRVSGA